MASEMQYCDVCLESHPIAEFPQRPPTAGCNHPVRVCLASLESSIRAQTDVKKWDAISCPTCAGVLQSADIKEFADATTFAR